MIGFRFFKSEITRTSAWLGAVTLALLFLWYVPEAAAQAPDPTAADGILSKLIGWVKSFAKAALMIIVIISFVVAAYAGISALMRFVGGREDWGGMFMIFLVAIIATVFVGQLAYDGQQQIDALQVGGGTGGGGGGGGGGDGG